MSIVPYCIFLICYTLTWTALTEIPYNPLNPDRGPYRPSRLIRLSDGSPVVGRRSEGVNKKRATEYLGIPYAEPPIGRRRFAAPVRKAPWDVLYNASQLSNSCPQTRDAYFGSGFYGAEMWNANTPLNEDCLYLNVWVPGWDTVGNEADDPELSGLGRSKKKLFPVMVWIYGGGFFSGTSSLAIYDGKILSTEENVIIVSMNYRVSLFGFLYLGISEVAGNMGMLDQLEALKWVHRNIVHFGGDPECVTLFGESAGAGSVSLHSISPLSQPYFKRFVLQSGSAIAQWAISPKNRILERSIALAQSVGCLVGKTDHKKLDTKSIFECLQKAPVDLLLKFEWQTNNELLDMPWTPIVDGYFIVEEPRVSFETGRFKNGQAMAGSNLHEANYFLVYHLSEVYKKDKLFNQTEFIFSQLEFEKAVLAVLPSEFSSNPVVTQAILFEYSPHEFLVSPYVFQDALDKIVGDYHFTCNVQAFSTQFEKHGGSLYSYHFTHRSSVQTWPKWMGVLHGYEINYIFGEPLNPYLPQKYSEEEERLSRRFMRYWANFARAGNPNINRDGSFMPDNWPIFTRNQDYLTLSTKISIGYGPRIRQCAFWQVYIPELLESTRDLIEVEIKWKQEFNRWYTEYIVDWKSQFDQFKQLQRHSERGTDCLNHEL